MEFQAKQIAEKIKRWNPTLNVDITTDNEVRAITKSITLDKEELKELAGIVGLHTISFGRSGPNFRMIID